MRNELVSIYGMAHMFMAILSHFFRFSHMIFDRFFFSSPLLLMLLPAWVQTSAFPPPVTATSNHFESWQKYYINMTQRSIKDKINILLTRWALFSPSPLNPHSDLFLMFFFLVVRCTFFRCLSGVVHFIQIDGFCCQSKREQIFCLYWKLCR